MNPTYDQTTYDPAPEQRYEYWQTAFGLQAVDNLEPSQYLKDLADQHVRGEKTYREVQADLESHYLENRHLDAEADRVSEAIYGILSDQAFTFAVATLKDYHRRLFEHLDPQVFRPGEFRQVNITKNEPILGGDTVQYQDFGLLGESLDYDFTEEKAQDYVAMSDDERIARIANFTSRIWQVHPFIEGNTRTTAVFIEKYLRSLGYTVDNQPFEDHSLYFRNALVRANYTNVPENVAATPQYLEKFFRNLLLSEKNSLDNAELYLKGAQK